jgi:predicted phage terminase large subunit-like protein
VKSVCVEGSSSGLLKCLGGERGGLIRNWNRSEGVVYLENGAKVFTDGADDGAFRIQGKNLHGAWCDEVGLWQKWETSWNYSLRPAIRFEPALIIATGTPKMGHPLIQYLLEAPDAVSTHMPTSENIENLYGSSIEAMMREWQGTTLGRQELEGEFIEALEGEILRRPDWRYYPPARSFYAQHTTARYEDLPRFTQIVCSWDTAVKDKTTGDFWAGQAWGVVGADRFLLRLFHEHAGFEQGLSMIRELTEWAQATWPRVAVRTIVEAAGLGPDIVKQLEREVQGLKAIPAKGDKVQRAWAASPALETHHCVLPGRANQLGDSYEASLTPTDVQKFVDECALFRADMKHAHDDQVDAWSQMVNWTRQARASRIQVPQGQLPAAGALAGISSWDRMAGL